MVRSIDHGQIWEVSSTKSFYNSSNHAEFMSQNGQSITLIELTGSNGPVYAPISCPNVWTWWRDSKIPIPPRFGSRSSQYLGLLAPSDSGIGNPTALLSSIQGKKKLGIAPARFVQPALTENGILPNLEEFFDAIKASGLDYSNTETRIVKLPEIRSGTASHRQNIDTSTVLESHTYSELGETFISKRRYDIRRAARSGVKLEIRVVASTEDAAEIYGSIMPLHRESWTRTGLGSHTFEYWTGFSKAIRESGGSDIVIRAFMGDEIISVVVVHLRGVCAFYQMNSSNSLGLKLGANPYTLHAAMGTSALIGAKYFELGRYSDDDSEKTRSVNEYKAQFGGFVVPVPNFDIPAH
jgi:hypothetical protein